MKTYARIENQTVVELLTTAEDISTLFPPDLVWVASEGADVAVGWRYTDGAFSAPAAPSLTDAKSAQIVAMTSAYEAEVSQDVTFTTAAGVPKTFQADAKSRDMIREVLAAFTGAGKLPADFYWLSSDNTHVTFTLNDVQGLSAAIGAQGWTAFKKLQALKAEIAAAAIASDVRSVTW